MEQSVSISHHSHVLIFPLPVQGHVKPMLKLAELLSIAGLNITFLNFDHVHGDLVRYTDVEARFSKYPGFQFKTIPNWIPVDVDDTSRSNDIFELVAQKLEALDGLSKPHLEIFLIESKPSVTCIIGDILFSYVQDIAKELGIPFIQFQTASACSHLASLSIPRFIANGELPIKGKEDLDRLVTKVPCMETFLRCRDLPSFCRISDVADPKYQIFFEEREVSKALIINTFEELEAPILSQIRTHSPKTYTIGPLHQLLKTKLGSVKMQESYLSLSNSLWEEDRNCMSWLDDQPSQSVLYISFGSLSFVTRNQLMELWHGIVNSKKRFLWAIRHDSVTNEDGATAKIPEEFQVGPKKNGYIVNWAPQEKVLAHKAVGGFLTHSGWNSILESIAAGVPMICWPYFGDQQVNSRFVSEVWKIGLDMKDVCDREIVEKMVNDLMVNRKEEFVKSIANLAELTKRSVSEGGSSSCFLDILIEDIRLMSNNGPAISCNTLN